MMELPGLKAIGCVDCKAPLEACVCADAGERRAVLEHTWAIIRKHVKQVPMGAARVPDRVASAFKALRLEPTAVGHGAS